VPAAGKRGIARPLPDLIERPVPDLVVSMANKPLKDITDRDLFFAGLVMAPLPAGEPDNPMSVHSSRAIEAADHLIAALKVPIGKPPRAAASN
jgi:hypothetical protein